MYQQPISSAISGQLSPCEVRKVRVLLNIDKQKWAENLEGSLLLLGRLSHVLMETM
jgi:hypothetical protein